tara:strand:- start:83 stop:328 length:246 start_codon:yes stop_codon:yes gene_type:complete
MENNETYYIARLTKKGKFLSSEIFETLESARLWAMKETKLLVSDTFLRKCKADDIVVEIDKYFLAYELDSEELFKNGIKVA